MAEARQFSPLIAFSGYEGHIRKTIRDWFSKLDELQGPPFDISLWSLLISFDNMGRAGYSTEWGVVKTGRHNHFLDLLEATFRAIGKFGRLQWPLGQ